MMRALVIGHGSIGRRHVEVLQQLGCAVAVVSRRAVDFPLVYADAGEALAAHAPGYVVVANETGAHAGAFAALAGARFGGTVLIEKPLFHAPAALPRHAFGAAYVAYNLRFHPMVLRMRELLAGETLVSATVHVGQYLPDWRPGSDYRQSYSASAAQGGGVLRDLSHELDYLCWLLGGWNRVAALGGQFSALEITSDDVFSLLLTTPRCPVVSVHMNYLDRRVRRGVTINTLRGTLEADLATGSLHYLGVQELFATERNSTYLAMHAAVLAGRTDVACTLAEGLATVELIDAAARAAANKEWIQR
ncbi:Gfo/Idh/MocA family protein [Massilia glaciei]|uniref:Gfo/Idh/MocA family oxidoreductase n=1 Tax=Massilia glaciei TaxID=1524097 RepID=A0A2U2HN54_9BURK|nr:Gfo/Idh/MocA family oxidoreductase [Massilia glaciei]PWF48933.1 gfo/Idh/MocA family oxidoreductase [Massilia glaciei]